MEESVTNFDVLKTLFYMYYRPLCYHAFNFISDDSISQNIVLNAFVLLKSDQCRWNDTQRARLELYNRVRSFCQGYLKKTENSKEIIIAPMSQFSIKDELIQLLSDDATISPGRRKEVLYNLKHSRAGQFV